MRVCVTGAKGFIGSRLDLAAHFTKLLDLTDGDDILLLSTSDEIKHFDPEVVYHLAARHFIPWCEQHPDSTFANNVLGTAQVLLGCGPALRTFVFTSSAAVYGFGPGQFSEMHMTRGKGIYANTKKVGETLLQSYSDEHPEVRCVAARMFNVVGAGDKHAHVLPSIVQSLMSGEKVHLGNIWPKRDYVHVQDAADALQFLAAHAPIGHSVFNVGTGIGTSVGDLLMMVEQETGLLAEMVDDTGRDSDGDLVSDPTRINELGWVARRTVNDAVHDVVREALGETV